MALFVLFRCVFSASGMKYRADSHNLRLCASDLSLVMSASMYVALIVLPSSESSNIRSSELWWTCALGRCGASRWTLLLHPRSFGYFFGCFLKRGKGWRYCSMCLLQGDNAVFGLLFLYCSGLVLTLLLVFLSTIHLCLFVDFNLCHCFWS